MSDTETIKRYEVELGCQASTYVTVEAASEEEAAAEALRLAESPSFMIGQDFYPFGYSVDAVEEAS